MAIKFHGNVRGEVRVNFVAPFASKPHVFMCGALKLSGIVRANVRLNIASPMRFWSQSFGSSQTWLFRTWLFAILRGSALSRSFARAGKKKNNKQETHKQNFHGIVPGISRDRPRFGNY